MEKTLKIKIGNQSVESAIYDSLPQNIPDHVLINFLKSRGIISQDYDHPQWQLSSDGCLNHLTRLPSGQISVRIPQSGWRKVEIEGYHYGPQSILGATYYSFIKNG